MPVAAAAHLLDPLPLPQQVSDAHGRGRYVGAIPQAGQGALVVTYEEAAALGGQAQAGYHVYLARTARTAHGWWVTQWLAAAERRVVTTAGANRAHSPRRARLAHAALESYGLLWLGTLLAAIVAIPTAGEVRSFMGLRVTAASSASAAMAALLAANNLRVAAVPLLLAALSNGRRRWLAIVGDVVESASLTVSVALGGLALGAYGRRLVAYLPQWPLGWGGPAFAPAGWRRARLGRRDVCELLLLAIGAAIFICLAALLETYAVPQA